LPDLIIPRGSEFIKDYNNPSLFPGMFPTLFPFGIGGFDVKERKPAIGFDKQAEYFMDCADRRFRSHRLFMFVALNVIQKHMAQLKTYLTVRRDYFETIANKLLSIDPKIIDEVAELVNRENGFASLTDEQRSVFTLLNQINAVAARVPGSAASKLNNRNDMRAYAGFFGIPAIYITMNPTPVHSPIFQAYIGNEKINLFERYPILPKRKVRAVSIAEDPVAAADFFEHTVQCFLQHMLGWDPVTRKSKPEGGILGHMKAY
ncbi:hypothetical protein SISNIDRAFT_396662, partial [Sistotremastrum niveocremeum HHB9708]